MANADGLVTTLPEGTVGRRIRDEFGSKTGFSNIPSDDVPTLAELTQIVKDLWTATERSFYWLAMAVGNPLSPPRDETLATNQPALESGE